MHCVSNKLVARSELAMIVDTVLATVVVVVVEVGGAGCKPTLRY